MSGDAPTDADLDRWADRRHRWASERTQPERVTLAWFALTSLPAGVAYGVCRAVLEMIVVEDCDAD